MTDIKVLENWNVSNGNDFSSMFNGCRSLSNIKGLENWNVSNGNNFSSMFSGCESLSDIKVLENWNVFNGNNFSSMFSGCESLSDIKALEKWNVSNGNNFSSMFNGCKSLSDIKSLQNWKVSNGNDFKDMFNGCESLSDIKALQNWNVSNGKHISSMFNGCSSLTDIEPLKIMNDLVGLKNSFTKTGDNDDYNNIIDINKEIISKLKKNIIRNENLKYLPQIEIKYNHINNITEKKIRLLKIEISKLLNEKDFSIIEIKKGSLTLIISLQFIIFEKIKNKRILDLLSSEKMKKEVEEICRKIENNNFISLGTTRPDFVDKDIILLDKKYRAIIKEKMDNNKIDSNNININEMSLIEEIDTFFKEISKDAELQENNQFRLIAKLDDFNKVFDEVIEKALKNSYFEFKIAYIFLVDKDITYYNNAKNSCENREEKILYHGTRIEFAIDIISDNFDLTKNKRNAIGDGIYCTDSLDYAGKYARKTLTIPKVGELFTIVSSEIYYDNKKVETIYSYGLIPNDKIPENGIRCCYGYFDGLKLSKKQFNENKKPIGKEYLIPSENQTLPLFAITLKRIEYLVIWRDYNFNSDNPNRYSRTVFEEIQTFHREMKKIISREFDSKVYYIKTNEEALELIERKKYNKIIIITNGNNNAKDFIISAREKIGGEVIVALSLYNINLHINWIKTMNNILVLNGLDFHRRFFASIMKNENDTLKALKDLRNEVIETFLHSYPNFELKEPNNDSLKFPKFQQNVETKINYNDLTFDSIIN